MKNKKDMWIIVAVMVAIIYGRINSTNKIWIPLILLGLGIIAFVGIIIWIINQKIKTYKYGPEEIIKIEDIIIKEKNIDKYAEILSSGKVNHCDEETLINDCTIRITMKTKTDELIKNVNELLEKIGYDICISEEDIFKEDYEFIKIRRKAGYTTLRHDINVIINILNNNNLEAINLEKDNKGDINMGIVSFDKLEELIELGDYDENIEE